jgi:hypothetical protein
MFQEQVLLRNCQVTSHPEPTLPKLENSTPTFQALDKLTPWPLTGAAAVDFSALIPHPQLPNLSSRLHTQQHPSKLRSQRAIGSEDRRQEAAAAWTGT